MKKLLGRPKSWKKNQSDDELSKIEQQIEAARLKREDLILKRAQKQGMPDSWTTTATDNKTLVEVEPTGAEYWDVAEQLQASMPDAHVSNLWRVQNLSLWAHYSEQKDRLDRKGGSMADETKVFLGTSSTDPSTIYDSSGDGCMMEAISRNGFWGRGVYFSEQSTYSHVYAFQPNATAMLFAGSNDRPYPCGEEHEMFLTKLLVGSAVDMNRGESEAMKQTCLARTSPPEDPTTREKYDTVTGRTDRTKVYVIYENNGRAYPEYLIRYYRGDRDSKRTPFASRKDAAVAATSTSTPRTSLSDLSDVIPLRAPVVPTWEFHDNSGWSQYSAAHQREIESFYQAYRNNPRLYRPTLIIQTNVWQYEIDVARMKQRNLQHFNHRERDIQRTVGPSSA